MNRDEQLKKAKQIGKSLACLSQKAFPYDLHRLEKKRVSGLRFLEVEKKIHSSFSKQIKRLEKNREFLNILHGLCVDLNGLVTELSGKYSHLSQEINEQSTNHYYLKENFDETSKIWSSLLGKEKEALQKVKKTTPSKNLQKIIEVLTKALDLEIRSNDLKSSIVDDVDNKNNSSELLNEFLKLINSYKNDLELNLLEVKRELNLLDLGEENIQAARTTALPKDSLNDGLRLIRD